MSGDKLWTAEGVLTGKRKHLLVELTAVEMQRHPRGAKYALDDLVKRVREELSPAWPDSVKPTDVFTGNDGDLFVTIEYFVPDGWDTPLEWAPTALERLLGIVNHS